MADDEVEGDALDDEDDFDEGDEDVPNPPYDPPLGTTWAEWHDA